MLGYVVAQMEQREDFLGKEHVGDVRTQELARWDCSLVVAIDELGAVASAQARKAELTSFAYSNSSKGRSSGVILVVASQFASASKCLQMR